MPQGQRHERQITLPWCGQAGQSRIRGAHVLVVGCGALGCASIEWLARAGVGQLTLVDRDVVEWSNLQRQQLFSERDAQAGAPKAEAAARRVKEIDSTIRVHACVEHVNAENAADLARGVNVIVDGLDNIETRFVLNDVSVRDGIPYVYAAAVAMEGRCMVVLPRDVAVDKNFSNMDVSNASDVDARISKAGKANATSNSNHFAARGACLRCVYPDMPAPGVLPTCDLAGVMGPVVGMVGAFAASQALFLLAGRADLLERKLWSVDLAAHRHATIAISIDEHCACCGKKEFSFLQPSNESARVAHLCGRGSIQVLPARRKKSDRAALDMDLSALEKQLLDHGQFARRGGSLHGQLRNIAGLGGEPVELTVFADGRAIVGRCSDETLARSIYDRFIGG
ncbi:MAG: thiazole biosynthesis adenylyltransferase ThiF [Phycisphaerales bacterium]|nr:thiazole biosynthesis adenylyltransferase ThiF [Phycisphaerales bacterium]